MSEIGVTFVDKEDVQPTAEPSNTAAMAATASTEKMPGNNNPAVGSTTRQTEEPLPEQPTVEGTQSRPRETKEEHAKRHADFLRLYGEGMSLSEIAKYLGIKVQQCKGHLAEAVVAEEMKGILAQRASCVTVMLKGLPKAQFEELCRLLPSAYVNRIALKFVNEGGQVKIYVTDLEATLHPGVAGNPASTGTN